jgi:hypothetical protein
MAYDVLEYPNPILKEVDLDSIYILEVWLNKLSKKIFTEETNKYIIVT